MGGGGQVATFVVTANNTVLFRLWSGGAKWVVSANSTMLFSGGWGGAKH